MFSSNFDQEEKLDLLLGVYVCLLVVVNLLGAKVISLFGIGVSVGIFMMPLTFLITDIIAEVKGKEAANHFVLVGILTLLIMVLFTVFSVSLPAHERFAFSQEYNIVFNLSLRITIASLVAFIVSQLNDVFIFHWLKKVTKGRALWLRNNLSTMLSQGIDTMLFMFLAFYAASPQFTAMFVLELVATYWLFKIAFAALDTPLVYIGVRWLNR